MKPPIANGIESRNRERGANNEAALPSLNYSLIQRVQKKFKTHRGALDFDKRFILSKVVDVFNWKVCCFSTPFFVLVDVVFRLRGRFFGSQQFPYFIPE
jgi:hypothetical protein